MSYSLHLIKPYQPVWIGDRERGNCFQKKTPELISGGSLFQRPAFLDAFLVAFAVALATFVAALVTFVAALVTFFASLVIFLAAFIILKINGCTKLSFLFIKDNHCLSQSQFYFNKQPNLEYARVISAGGWRKEAPGGDFWGAFYSLFWSLFYRYYKVTKDRFS